MKVATSACGHLGALMKGLFLDSGQIITISTQEYRLAPILRKLKEGKDGRLLVTRDWMEVRFCPECGCVVKYVEKDEKAVAGA